MISDICMLKIGGDDPYKSDLIIPSMETKHSLELGHGREKETKKEVYAN